MLVLMLLSRLVKGPLGFEILHGVYAGSPVLRMTFGNCKDDCGRLSTLK